MRENKSVRIVDTIRLPSLSSRCKMCVFIFRVTVCLNDQNITRAGWIDEEKKKEYYCIYVRAEIILYTIFSCVCSDDTVKKNKIYIFFDLPDSYDNYGHYIHSLRAL